MTNHGFRMGTPNNAYIGKGVTVKGAIFEVGSTGD